MSKTTIYLVSSTRILTIHFYPLTFTNYQFLLILHPEYFLGPSH